MSFGQTNTAGAALQAMTGQGNPRMAYGRPYTPTATEDISSIRAHARNTTTSDQSVTVGIFDITAGRAGALLAHSLSINIPANSAVADWRVGATAYQLLSTKIYAYAFVSNVNAGWELSRQTTAGVLESHSTVTNYTMPTIWASGSASSLDALIEIVTTPAGPGITSINGGSPITPGQVNIPSTAVNFTGLPTAIAANAAGVNCGSIGGTATAPTFTISNRVDGGAYPKSGASVLFTFTRGAESSSLAQIMVKKATETAVTLTAPLFSANTLASAILAQTGRTVAAADEFYYTTYGDLVITPDTDYTATTGGSFDLWLWVSSGVDAGKMFNYAVTISAGVIIGVGVPQQTRLLTMILPALARR